MHHAGEFAALLTAFFWTITALSFEAASRRLGSMVVNVLRLMVGFCYLTLFTFFYRGAFLPMDAPSHAWLILSLSGLVGFVFGDLCLLQAFVLIGARISMLMMALSPPMTAIISRIFLGESLGWKSILGMVITLTGIALVVLKRNPAENGKDTFRTVRFNYPVWGILLGLGGALGQAVGLVLSKTGMKGYDTFASTQIRVIAGIAGFSILATLMGLWKEVFRGLRRTRPMLQLSLGAFFGPFLGVPFR
jgi:drug/metabolite transporter (DMT)-like permease